MARQITSLAQLQKVMDKACKMQCLAIQEKFYQVLDSFINQYYNEWQPNSEGYQRTFRFLHSAFKSKIVKTLDGYECKVFIDTDSMNEYVNATGYEVAMFANEATHGGYDAKTNTHVWDDTIDNTITNGDLIKLAKSFLIGYGFIVN